MSFCGHDLLAAAATLCCMLYSGSANQQGEGESKSDKRHSPRHLTTQGIGDTLTGMKADCHQLLLWVSDRSIWTND